MNRRAIILAGGSGTRLNPLTRVVSKQLLPVFDKPMIYYPLSVIMLAGIREVLIITTPDDHAMFKRLLGDGADWGLSISYEVQPSPDGLAQAFLIGEDFVRGRPSCLVLGDNILYGQGLPAVLQDVSRANGGATIFGYRVNDPERYGVIEANAAGRVLSIEEKPQKPKSNWAAIGLYFYDEQVVDLVKDLSPSKRGELEITDLNALYLQAGRLEMRRLGRGVVWFDAGTHESLQDAGEFVRVLQTRQGQLICAPEEIAHGNGWIDDAQLSTLAVRLRNTEYGRHLLANLTRDG